MKMGEANILKKMCVITLEISACKTLLKNTLIRQKKQMCGEGNPISFTIHVTNLIN